MILVVLPEEGNFHKNFQEIEIYKKMKKHFKRVSHTHKRVLLHRRLMPIILATQEAENRRIIV
jgi:hypothetical protein